MGFFIEPMEAIREEEDFQAYLEILELHDDEPETQEDYE